MFLDLEAVLVVRPQVGHLDFVVGLCAEDDSRLLEDLRGLLIRGFKGGT